VADDEEVLAGRRGAVLRLVDLAVGRVDADAQNLDQDAAAAGDIGDARLGKLGEVGRVGRTGMNSDGFDELGCPSGKREGPVNPGPSSLLR
jgi:hypothetical protein